MHQNLCVKVGLPGLSRRVICIKAFQSLTEVFHSEISEQKCVDIITRRNCLPKLLLHIRSSETTIGPPCRYIQQPPTMAVWFRPLEPTMNNKSGNFTFKLKLSNLNYLVVGFQEVVGFQPELDLWTVKEWVWY